VPAPSQVLAVVCELELGPSEQAAARQADPEAQKAQPVPAALHVPVWPQEDCGVVLHTALQQMSPSQLLLWHCAAAVHTPPFSSTHVMESEVTEVPGTVPVAVRPPPAKLQLCLLGCDAMVTV